MRNYETMVILDPTLDESGLKQQADKIKEIISSNGEVVSVDEWGRRELAYEIKGHNEGYYLVIQFKAAPEISQQLNTEFRMNPNIIRGIVVREED